MQNVKERSTVAQDVQQPYAYPGTHWRFGFVPSAEIWNGRLAMIGFLSAVLIEIFSGQGVLHFWGIM